MMEKVVPKLKPQIRAYITKYCRSQGYTMTGLTFVGGLLHFQIKPAPPREEKRRATPETSSQNPPSR